MNIKLASLIPSDMRGSFFANSRYTTYSTTATKASENRGLEKVKKSFASTMIECCPGFSKKDNDTSEQEAHSSERVWRDRGRRGL
jgi:hypothetical protein